MPAKLFVLLKLLIVLICIPDGILRITPKFSPKMHQKHWNRFSRGIFPIWKRHFFDKVGLISVEPNNLNQGIGRTQIISSFLIFSGMERHAVICLGTIMFFIGYSEAFLGTYPFVQILVVLMCAAIYINISKKLVEQKKKINRKKE
uniref:Uncharacterized protein n=1 Tax=Vaucheria litorea TaxID=109269 RepID=H6WBC2_VAULI|nr:hypothetical protein [Vaucheria litorea]